MSANLSLPVNQSTYVALAFSVDKSSAVGGTLDFVNFSYTLTRRRCTSTGGLISGESATALRSATYTTSGVRNLTHNDSGVVVGNYYQYVLNVTTRWREELADGVYNNGSILETSSHVIQRYVGRPAAKAKNVVIDTPYPLNRIKVTFNQADDNASASVIKYDIRTKPWVYGEGGLLNYNDNPLSDTDWEFVSTPSGFGVTTRSIYVTDSYSNNASYTSRGSKQFLRVFTYAYASSITEASDNTPTFTWENVPNVPTGITCTTNQYNGVLVRWGNTVTNQLGGRVVNAAVYRNGVYVGRTTGNEFLDDNAPVGSSSYYVRFFLEHDGDTLYSGNSVSVTGVRLAYPSPPSWTKVPSSCLLRNGLFALGPAGMSISSLESGSVFYRSTDQIVRCVYNETLTLGSEGNVFTLSSGIKSYLTAGNLFFLVGEKNNGVKESLEGIYFEYYRDGYVKTSKILGYNFNGAAYYGSQNTVNTENAYRKVHFYFINVSFSGYTPIIGSDNLSGQVYLDRNSFIVGSVDYSDKKVVSLSTASNGLVSCMNYEDDIVPVGNVTVDAGYFCTGSGVIAQVLGTQSGPGWEFDLPAGIIKRGGAVWWHSGYGRNRCVLAGVRQFVIAKNYGTFKKGPITHQTGIGPFAETSYIGTTITDGLFWSSNSLAQVSMNFPSYPSGALYAISMVPTLASGNDGGASELPGKGKGCTIWAPLAEGEWYFAYQYRSYTVGPQDWLQGEPLPRGSLEFIAKMYIGRFGNQLRTRWEVKVDARNSYADDGSGNYRVAAPEFNCTVVQIV